MAKGLQAFDILFYGAVGGGCSFAKELGFRRGHLRALSHDAQSRFEQFFGPTPLIREELIFLPNIF